MNFIQIAKLIITMLPTIISAIKAVEEAIPGEGKGELKLKAAREMLESAYAVAPVANTTFDTIWPAIQGTIDSLVSIFKKTGQLKK